MGVGAALYYYLKYLPLDISSEGLIFSRMPNMQVLCPYYVKTHMKAMMHWQMCGCIFESIIKQFIKHLFIQFDCYFALNQNVVVQ